MPAPRRPNVRNASCSEFRKVDSYGQSGKSARTRRECEPGLAGKGVNLFYHSCLTLGVEKFIVMMRRADPECGLARGRAVALGGSDMQRVADQFATRGVDRGIGQHFGIARQQRGERRVGLDTRVSERA